MNQCFFSVIFTPHPLLYSDGSSMLNPKNYGDGYVPFFHYSPPTFFLLRFQSCTNQYLEFCTASSQYQDSDSVITTTIPVTIINLISLPHLWWWWLLLLLQLLQLLSLLFGKNQPCSLCVCSLPILCVFPFDSAQFSFCFFLFFVCPPISHVNLLY